jgi:hypothetical protein
METDYLAEMVRITRQHLADDADTIGEVCGAVNRLEAAVSDLADDLHDLSVKFERHQANRLRRSIDAA